VCALLFVVTTINYVDRQVLASWRPTLQRELGWSEATYGDVVSWFSLPYAFGFLAAGRLSDRIGVRRGFAAAVVAWSLAAIAHAFAGTTALFSAARALLGVAESANFPGAIKAVAEWFPKKERALATGIFNAGTNTGAILTPLLVPGSRSGGVGSGLRRDRLPRVRLAGLLARPIPQSRVEPACFERRAGAISAATHPTREHPCVVDRLLGYRQTWAIAAGNSWPIPSGGSTCTGSQNPGLDIRHQACTRRLPLIVIYLVSDVGSIGGGWLRAP